MSTGFFGIPGKTPRGTGAKVHVIHTAMNTISGGKEIRTLCGWKPSPGNQFQWCAHGVNLKMIECSKCRAAGLKLLRLQLA